MIYNISLILTKVNSKIMYLLFKTIIERPFNTGNAKNCQDKIQGEAQRVLKCKMVADVYGIGS